MVAEARAMTKLGAQHRLLYKSTDRVARSIGARFPSLIYGKRVSTASKGSEILAAAINAHEPFVAARLGSNEQNILRYFTKHRQESHRVPASYPEGLRNDIMMQAGVRPADDDTLDQFSSLYLEAAQHVDILGVWFHHSERSLVRKTLPEASKLIPLRSMDPLSFPGSWTSALRGRSVCVVHPFGSSIASQYARRHEIFDDPNVLPDFDLKIVKAVQAIGGLPEQYETWFSARCASEVSWHQGGPYRWMPTIVVWHRWSTMGRPALCSRIC
jgi:hypothetical protein